MSEICDLKSLPPGWRRVLISEAGKPYFKALSRFVQSEYQSKCMIYPPKHWMFRAFDSVDYDEVRVVILGQDPYHGDGQAIGLSFGVPNDLQRKPPSLGNIFKELNADLAIQMDKRHSDLTGWAGQGVFLLNSVLTVRAGQAFSHRESGWETFTDREIDALNARRAPVVFVLWGAAAQRKEAMITSVQHFVLKSAHPSPLSASRGFLGSRPFSKINDILKDRMLTSPIDWKRTSAVRLSRA